MDLDGRLAGRACRGGRRRGRHRRGRGTRSGPGPEAVEAWPRASARRKPARTTNLWHPLCHRGHSAVPEEARVQRKLGACTHYKRASVSAGAHNMISACSVATEADNKACMAVCMADRGIYMVTQLLPARSKAWVCRFCEPRPYTVTGHRCQMPCVPGCAQHQRGEGAPAGKHRRARRGV